MKKVSAILMLALVIFLGLGGLQIATAQGVDEVDGQNNNVDDGAQNDGSF